MHRIVLSVQVSLLKQKAGLGPIAEKLLQNKLTRQKHWLVLVMKTIQMLKVS